MRGLIAGNAIFDVFRNLESTRALSFLRIYQRNLVPIYILLNPLLIKWGYWYTSTQQSGAIP